MPIQQAEVFRHIPLFKKLQPIAISHGDTQILEKAGAFTHNGVCMLAIIV